MKNSISPKVSIIILNWNVKELLEACLNSIYREITNINFEVFVVDNNSSDGSQKMVWEKFPQVKLITNKKNLGFSKANNLAIKKARGKYILILNPDTIINNKAITKPLFFLKKHPKVGMVGVRLTDENGKIQFTAGRNLPSIWGEVCSYFNLHNTSLGKTRLFGGYLMSYWNHQGRKRINAISGAYMMVKAHLLKKLHGFDESFFMYGEDLDLCYRVQKSGFKIFFLGDMEVIHWGAKSSSYSASSMIRSGTAEIDALYHYFEKNKSNFYALSYKFIFRALALLGLIRRKIFSIVPAYRQNEIKMTRIEIDKRIIYWNLK